MSTALFLKITACLPHYFEKLPHVYRIFSFLKDMRHRIILKKLPHVNTALDGYLDLRCWYILLLLTWDRRSFAWSLGKGRVVVVVVVVAVVVKWRRCGFRWRTTVLTIANSTGISKRGSGCRFTWWSTAGLKRRG